MGPAINRCYVFPNYITPDDDDVDISTSPPLHLTSFFWKKKAKKDRDMGRQNMEAPLLDSDHLDLLAANEKRGNKKWNRALCFIFVLLTFSSQILLPLLSFFVVVFCFLVS